MRIKTCALVLCSYHAGRQGELRSASASCHSSLLIRGEIRYSTLPGNACFMLQRIHEIPATGEEAPFKGALLSSESAFYLAIEY